MKIEKGTAGGPPYHTVLVAKDELVVDSGRTLPYSAWIGTIGDKSGKVTLWYPAAYRPRGYKQAALALLEQAKAELGHNGDPVGVEPFDRDEFIDSAARAMFVSAWADDMEEQGRSDLISGVQLYDVAPATPAEAKRAARALGRAYERANSRKLKSLWKLAVTVPGKHYRDPTVDDFGYGLAMQALGHGVGWEDNHPSFPLVTPHFEFHVSGNEIDWAGDDTGRLDSPNRQVKRNPRRAKRKPGKAMRTNGKVLGHIGDVNPIEYGGGPAWQADGEAMLAYTHGLETDHPGEHDDEQDLELTVYTVSLHSTGAEFLSWYDWVDWADVASSTGMDVDELIGYAGSNDPMTRAMVVVDVAGYYGWHELDTYPITSTVGELEEQWFPGGYLAKTL